MADSSFDEAINAGLILVVSVFMAFVTFTVGDLFNFGYYEILQNTTDPDYTTGDQLETEPSNLTEGTDYEYVSGTGDEIVTILPVVVLLVGMLASFLKLRDVANQSY